LNIFAVDGGAARCRRLLRVGQMSFRNTGWPSARAERLGVRSMSMRAGERVRDDERRRGEVVHLHLRMHAAFEVAVAREHRGADDVAGLHAGRDLGFSGPELPMHVVQP
jgi:hypothetical protein